MILKFEILEKNILKILKFKKKFYVILIVLKKNCLI